MYQEAEKCVQFQRLVLCLFSILRPKKRTSCVVNKNKNFQPSSCLAQPKHFDLIWFARSDPAFEDTTNDDVVEVNVRLKRLPDILTHIALN